MTDNATLPTVGAKAPPAELNAIAADHAKWVNSSGKEGKRANLRGMDLSFINMAGWQLVEASLRGTNLTGANLSGADLRTADLAEAILDRADLTGTLLAGAILTQAQLHEAMAESADLTGADLSGAAAQGIHLARARLNGLVARDVHFEQADITHAFFRDANLRGAIFNQANLSSTDLTGSDCRGASFEQASFAGSVLKDTNFRDARLIDVNLQGADFSVALDVSPEIQGQLMHQERAKLQKEQAELASLRNNLEQREASVAEDKAQAEASFARIAELGSIQSVASVQLQKYVSGFTLRFIFWLLLTLGFAGLTGLTAMENQTVDIASLSLVSGGLLFLFLLSFLSMVRSRQVAGIIKRCAQVREQVQAGDAPVSAAPAAAFPSAAPTPTAAPVPADAGYARSGKKSGFGKRR